MKDTAPDRGMVAPNGPFSRGRLAGVGWSKTALETKRRQPYTEPARQGQQQVTSSSRRGLVHWLAVMRTALFTLLALTAITLAAVACGGDDNDGGSPTAASPTRASPTSARQAQETPVDGDLKTPGSETPEGRTPAPTQPGDTGPGPTPASRGTPATWIREPDKFFAENYPGKSPTEADCLYNPVTVLATCSGTDYAVDPPLTGQDISCALLLVDQQAVAIRCTSAEPLQTIYYQIQE